MISNMRENTPAKYLILVICSFFAVYISAIQVCSGQSTQSLHIVHTTPSRVQSAVDSVKDTAYKSSSSQLEAMDTGLSAIVTLKEGKLTVQAHNSDLTQIINDLAVISGMKIDRFDIGPRVFGVYGPGNPRDILYSLLASAGCNFIMVGELSSGTPRELILSAQGSDLKSAPIVNPVNLYPLLTVTHGTTNQTVLVVPPAPEELLGPGAVVRAATPDDRDDSTRIQHNLQHLQAIQEQQQQSIAH